MKTAAISAILVLCSASLHAARGPVERRVINPQVHKSLRYGFPDEHFTQQGQARDLPPEGLGSASPSASPGAVIGYTWYDYQHNGSMGRMIHTEGGSGSELAHFTWMYLPAPVLEAREYRYMVYDLTAEVFTGPIGLQPDDEYAGWVGIDVTNDGKAVVGGHNKETPGGFYDPHFYWDFAAGVGFFWIDDEVPDSVEEYAGYQDLEPLWPKFRYVEGSNDTVLHVISMEHWQGLDDPKMVYYFRRVGSDVDPSAYWDYPPYVIDSVYTIAHDIAANDAGKTAIVWMANLPCPGDPDPLASGYECRQYPLWDNDVYYEISNDYGANWNGRVNITNYILTEGLQDSYRPYTDLSALIDLAGNLHIVWGARFWPADANEGGEAGLLRNRIFHWSENWPYIRTAHAAEWDQTTCNGGAWQLNAGKMSISECNGRFYVLFVQFNNVPSGVEDDCADEANPAYPNGAANGDLYVVISADGGLTWDQARNLTNSYTPGCDSVSGAGGPCDNDNWPSMNRYGRNVALNPGDTTTEVVIPAGGMDLGWYLDVQYINDKSAGGIVKNEGTWQQAEVKWFRLACVDEIASPLLVLLPSSIGFPAFTQHGVQKDTSVTIENVGNATLNYSVTIEEDTGPPGWLTVSGFSGVVPQGNTETGTVHLNTGGIVNDPGTAYQLLGRVIFNSNASSSPDVLEIDFVVSTVAVTNDYTESLGRYAITIVPEFRGHFVGYPPEYYDAATHRLVSPVLYDPNTIIGRSDYLRHGRLEDVTGVPVGIPLTVIGDAMFSLEPDGFQGPDSVKEIHTELKDLNMTFWGGLPAVRAGASAQEPIAISPGEIEMHDGENLPAESFFDVYVEVEIPDGGVGWGTTMMVGNDHPDALLVSADTIYSLPPRVVYVHDNSLSVAVRFRNSNLSGPYQWNVGDLLGFLVLAGHGVNFSDSPDDTVDFNTEMQTAPEAPQIECGDCDHSGGELAVNIADLTYLVAYLFSSGPPPIVMESGNMDGAYDGVYPITVTDVTYLVAYLFGGGPAPICWNTP